VGILPEIRNDIMLIIKVFFIYYQELADDMNGDPNFGEAASDGLRQQLWLAQNGFEGMADVLSVKDTGTLFNQDRVVTLTLKIQPVMIAVAFETTGKTVISGAAIPQVGERIKIKYNPANPTQFVVVGK
jgi:hypothetical protein